MFNKFPHKLIIILLTLFLLTTLVWGQEPPDKEYILSQIVVHAVNSYHYDPRQMDDELSKSAFQLYIKELDYSKRFLLQSDIEMLSRYETQIDNELRQGRHEFFDTVIDLLHQRVRDSQNISKELLAKPFDLNVDDWLELDPERRLFSKNQTELRELWRKILKYQVLQRYQELLASQEKVNGVKLTLEQKQQLQPKLEQQAREAVLRNTQRGLERVLTAKRQELFGNYINAVLNCLDPHSEYFTPQSREDFDIALGSSIEGIGVLIREDGDRIKIESILPGSPASRQKDLQSGDYIIKVAQGAAEPVDVSNMPVNEVVRLIRGKKSTEARLTIQKPDGRILVVSVIRDVLVMEETYARSALIVNRQTSQKIGYINLPSFYHDFKKNGRTSAGDMRNEITKLKTDKVNGLILDLRDNSGGYVKDSVDIAGLFIKTGPILQVRNRSGQREIYDDRDANIHYTGPVVVLVNSLSASAAEILAAALQDYQRAVIIGGPGTFGKGTIQSMIDLDQLLSSSYQSYKPLGSLKITDYKFYRINGSSTQHKGVTADLPLPDFYQYLDTGERTLKHALPWDTVAPLAYQKYVNPNRWDLNALRARSQSRVLASAGFKQINQSILQVKKRKDTTLQSLRLAQFLSEQDQLQREMEQAQKNQVAPAHLQVTGNSADLKAKRDVLLRKQFDEWYRGLHRDPYLEEATFILRDMLL